MATQLLSSIYGSYQYKEIGQCKKLVTFMLRSILPSFLQCLHTLLNASKSLAKLRCYHTMSPQRDFTPRRHVSHSASFCFHRVYFIGADKRGAPRWSSRKIYRHARQDKILHEGVVFSIYLLKTDWPPKVYYALFAFAASRHKRTFSLHGSGFASWRYHD